MFILRVLLSRNTCMQVSLLESLDCSGELWVINKNQ
jgi:hypothetical protein